MLAKLQPATSAFSATVGGRHSFTCEKCSNSLTVGECQEPVARSNLVKLAFDP